MSDTRALLSRITDLRKRLANAQGLLLEAGATVSAVKDAPPGTDLAEKLERDVLAGGRVQQLLDGSLRQIAGALKGEDTVRPTQLTARARRLLERARDLVGKLKPLASDPVLPANDPDDPLVRGVRSAAAVTESAVRLVQAFPESPGAQLRLCEGVDGVLTAAADRIGVLAAAAAQRRQRADRVDTLAHLLAGLHAGRAQALDPFTALADAVLTDARQGTPLTFLDAGPPHNDRDWLARHTAAHGLTTAQVVARLVKADPELNRHPNGPVLAALVHDVGLLGLEPELLAKPKGLDDGQRRTIERHPWAGAELVTRQLPSTRGLSEAIAGHHERLDGTGYPAGLKDGQIGALARLLAVADVYAAMCCPRPHRTALDPRTSLTDTLMMGEGGGLDTTWAERLLYLSFYPVGAVVELTDGSVGRVVATHPPRTDLHTPARPVVNLLTDSRGDWLPAPDDSRGPAAATAGGAVSGVGVGAEIRKPNPPAPFPKREGGEDSRKTL
jgi:HD-GYP domain-containing protein (c-di-GMP phosphodiesterase class II)